MRIAWLDGVLYCIGLVLIFVPAKSLPWERGGSGTKRVVKHTAGLISFSIGTIGIHREIHTEMGFSFIVSSMVGLLILSIVKVWWEKYLSDEE